jgi:6-phosphogluconate dehydrogenase (decarboxylating)
MDIAMIGLGRMGNNIVAAMRNQFGGHEIKKE